MIIDGRQPGDRYADEHQETLDEITWRMDDLGDTTGPDYQQLATSGETVQEGVEAVRAGLKTHLLAFGEYREISSVRFSSSDLADIRRTRLETLEAEELGPHPHTLFPGEDAPPEAHGDQT